MAFSKQHLYEKTDLINSQFHKALSHPARIAILKQLQLNGALAVQVIAMEHPISKEALSGHLKILRNAHLVTFEEKFPYTFYEVNEHNMERALQLLLGFFSLFKGKG